MGWFTLHHGARVRRRLGKAKRMHIADLLDDNAGCILGEVIGAAEKLIPLAIAPLSGRPCLHWVISVEEVGTAYDWVVRGSVDTGVPFTLRDATGTARVDAHGARVDLPSTPFQRHTIDTLRWPERNLFNGTKSKFNHPQQSRVRFREYVIQIGDQLVVAGDSVQEPTDESELEASYRAGPRMRPVMSGARNRPLLIGNP